MTIKIVLDSGHGQETAGKRVPDDSMREFEFNSVVANKIKNILSEYENVETYFTHDPTGKRDIPLKERTNYANKLNADLFLSIHANASGSMWSDSRGIETFIYITNPKTSRDIANEFQEQLVNSTRLKDRGLKLADFHVLRESNMPAVLVECGFMTNKTESELLKTDAYRSLVAGALAYVVIKHYNLKAKKTSVPQTIKKSKYLVHVGWFKTEEEATEFRDKMINEGYSTKIVIG